MIYSSPLWRIWWIVNILLNFCLDYIVEKLTLFLCCRDKVKLAVSICCRAGRKAYCLQVFSWVGRKLAVCCRAELEEKLIVSICVADRVEKLAIWTRREACCLPVLQSWQKAYCCRARMLCQLPRLLARPLYNQAVSGQMGLLHTSSSLSKWVLIRPLFSSLYPTFHNKKSVMKDFF